MNAHVMPIAPARAAPDGAKPVLSVRDLRVSFRRRDGSAFSVVDGVTFDVMPGSIIGIVGESGSGKSMTARSILRLTPRGGEVTGTIRFGDKDIFALSAAEVRQLRGGRIAMVFQDPMTSFNPVFTIGRQIGEAIRLHGRVAKAALTARVVNLLVRVGITRAEERAGAYPHEFSGGMRQRALTAMAVANEPAILVADEPTTALDVTVQDQIMELMRDLNERAGTAIVLITHNIAVVASLCHRVIVMYAGRVVEEGPVEQVLGDPQHPYTWSLLQSVPRLDREGGRLLAVKGQPPDPAALPAGCTFAPRCPFVEKRCTEEEPPLGDIAEGRRARCWVLMANAERAAA